MTDYYVNKSGNDAADGLAPSTAWATIQHAIDNIASGDTIWVGSGVYEENVDISVDKNYYVKADGYVIMDGSSIGGTAFGFSSPGDLYIYDFIILDYNKSFDQSARHRFYMDGIYTNSPMTVSGYRNDFDMINSVVFDTILFLRIGQAEAHTATFDHCTIIDANTALTYAYNHEDGHFDINSCYIEGQLDFGGNWVIDTLDYNNIRDSIIYKGTTYATLADFQSAYPNLAPNSINQAPKFNSDYTLKWSSPNIGAGETGDIGAREMSNYYTSGDDLFNGATLTNVILNANGNYELESGKTTGTILTAVLDFEEDVALENIRWEATEAYPSDVIDTENSDTEPNRRNIEYRSQTDAEGSFAQDDILPTWSTKERNEDLTLNCRYFQLRITLRNNGVAA